RGEIMAGRVTFPGRPGGCYLMSFFELMVSKTSLKAFALNVPFFTASLAAWRSWMTVYDVLFCRPSDVPMDHAWRVWVRVPSAGMWKPKVAPAAVLALSFVLVR